MSTPALHEIEDEQSPRSPQSPRALLPSLAVLAFVMFASYAGVGQVLLPNQLAIIDEHNKVVNLATITGASFIFTLLTQPIIGAFSDRTRSKMGRRAPWIMIGGAVGGLLLVGMGSMTSVLWVGVFWIVIQVSLNAVQGPFTAVVPDRYPKSRRGVASAMFGIGTALGLTIGVVAGGQLAANLGIAYALFGGLVLLATLAFVLVNRDYSSRSVTHEPLRWRTFIAAFWVSPRRHPDFAWAFVARFFFILGYFMVLFFQLYLLTDYIELSLPQANQTIGLLALASLATSLISIGVSGVWSDRIGRRKVFIYAASVLIALGFAVPVFLPTVAGMILMSAISGIGFGLYTACDTALMTEVLPKDGASAGKDLGILNIATNLPQALSTVAGGVLISLLGYQALFVFGIIAVLIAIVALMPIKSVR
ncbi:MFS transporter [Microbacterium sp. 2FI]|uniref:MFS transporter n=1 Tax=Microbacterium sp. 2FI TaxID=2502193 RepID=UPI00201645B3|nr:MFS transporter [Microbacterium sp. 2FI]